MSKQRRRVARLARESGVERLIHVSGLAPDPASAAPYIAARARENCGPAGLSGATSFARLLCAGLMTPF